MKLSDVWEPLCIAVIIS